MLCLRNIEEQITFVSCHPKTCFYNEIYFIYEKFSNRYSVQLVQRSLWNKPQEEYLGFFLQAVHQLLKLLSSNQRVALQYTNCSFAL